MKNDGFFLDRDGQMFRYKWLKSEGKEQYRLEKATYQPGSLGLPPENSLLSYHQLDQDMIVLTERAGGLTTFASWLRENQPNSWRMFSLRNMDDQNLAIRDDFLTGKPGNYILDRTSHVDTDNEFSEDLRDLARIANFLESPKWLESDSRFVCFSYEVENLQKDILFSTIFDRSNAYRLPQFNREEILGWLELLLEKNSITLTRESPFDIADFVRSAIGGQPKLTHILFRMVDDRLKAVNLKEAGLVEVFQVEANRLQLNPPNVVYRWKKELYGLLKNDPERRALMEKYAEGHVKPVSYDYSTDDMVFYLSGWVSLNREGEWGIRSECHRQWAIDVLRGDL